jgi:hypothetical protein
MIYGFWAEFKRKRVPCEGFVAPRKVNPARGNETLAGNALTKELADKLLTLHMATALR